MAAEKKRTRLRICELNPHLLCALCGGYLIDATTIVECLHSFCKTCILRYLETSNYCPICEVLIHKKRPWQNIRLDHTLQNAVYKLVPGLFKREMQRRRDFYEKNPPPKGKETEQVHVAPERIIFSEDEKFSVSLEFSPNGRAVQVENDKSLTAAYHHDKRFLLCPANVCIGHLKKFVRLKYTLPDCYQIDLFYSDEPLEDTYTLMDVAYIYSWRRENVLTLYYSFYQRPRKRRRLTAAAATTSRDRDTSSSKTTAIRKAKAAATSSASVNANGAAPSATTTTSTVTIVEATDSGAVGDGEGGTTSTTVSLSLPTDVTKNSTATATTITSNTSSSLPLAVPGDGQLQHPHHHHSHNHDHVVHFDDDDDDDDERPLIIVTDTPCTSATPLNCELPESSSGVTIITHPKAHAIATGSVDTSDGCTSKACGGSGGAGSGGSGVSRPLAKFDGQSTLVTVLPSVSDHKIQTFQSSSNTSVQRSMSDCAVHSTVGVGRTLPPNKVVHSVPSVQSVPNFLYPAPGSGGDNGVVDSLSGVSSSVSSKEPVAAPEVVPLADTVAKRPVPLSQPAAHTMQTTHAKEVASPVICSVPETVQSVKHSASANIMPSDLGEQQVTSSEAAGSRGVCSVESVGHSQPKSKMGQAVNFSDHSKQQQKDVSKSYKQSAMLKQQLPSSDSPHRAVSVQVSESLPSPKSVLSSPKNNSRLSDKSCSVSSSAGSKSTSSSPQDSSKRDNRQASGTERDNRPAPTVKETEAPSSAARQDKAKKEALQRANSGDVSRPGSVSKVPATVDRRPEVNKGEVSKATSVEASACRPQDSARKEGQKESHKGVQREGHKEGHSTSAAQKTDASPATNSSGDGAMRPRSNSSSMGIFERIYSVTSNCTASGIKSIFKTTAIVPASTRRFSEAGDGSAGSVGLERRASTGGAGLHVEDWRPRKDKHKAPSNSKHSGRESSRSSLDALSPQPPKKTKLDTPPQSSKDSAESSQLTNHSHSSESTKQVRSSDAASVGKHPRPSSSEAIKTTKHPSPIPKQTQVSSSKVIIPSKPSKEAATSTSGSSIATNTEPWQTTSSASSGTMPTTPKSIGKTPSGSSLSASDRSATIATSASSNKTPPSQVSPGVKMNSAAGGNVSQGKSPVHYRDEASKKKAAVVTGELRVRLPKCAIAEQRLMVDMELERKHSDSSGKDKTASDKKTLNDSGSTPRDHQVSAKGKLNNNDKPLPASMATLSPAQTKADKESQKAPSPCATSDDGKSKEGSDGSKIPGSSANSLKTERGGVGTAVVTSEALPQQLAVVTATSSAFTASNTPKTEQSNRQLGVKVSGVKDTSCVKVTAADNSGLGSAASGKTGADVKSSNASDVSVVDGGGGNVGDVKREAKSGMNRKNSDGGGGGGGGSTTVAGVKRPHSAISSSTNTNTAHVLSSSSNPTKAVAPASTTAKALAFTTSAAGHMAKVKAATCSSQLRVPNLGIPEAKRAKQSVGSSVGNSGQASLSTSTPIAPTILSSSSVIPTSVSKSSSRPAGADVTVTSMGFLLGSKDTSAILSSGHKGTFSSSVVGTGGLAKLRPGAAIPSAGGKALAPGQRVDSLLFRATHRLASIGQARPQPQAPNSLLSGVGPRSLSPLQKKARCESSGGGGGSPGGVTNVDSRMNFINKTFGGGKSSKETCVNPAASRAEISFSARHILSPSFHSHITGAARDRAIAVSSGRGRGVVGGGSVSSSPVSLTSSALPKPAHIVSSSSSGSACVSKKDNTNSRGCDLSNKRSSSSSANNTISGSKKKEGVGNIGGGGGGSKVLSNGSNRGGGGGGKKDSGGGGIKLDIPRLSSSSYRGDVFASDPESSPTPPPKLSDLNRNPIKLEPGSKLCRRGDAWLPAENGGRRSTGSVGSPSSLGSGPGSPLESERSPARDGRRPSDSEVMLAQRWPPALHPHPHLLAIPHPRDPATAAAVAAAAAALYNGHFKVPAAAKYLPLTADHMQRSSSPEPMPLDYSTSSSSASSK